MANIKQSKPKSKSMNRYIKLSDYKRISLQFTKKNVWFSFQVKGENYDRKACKGKTYKQQIDILNENIGYAPSELDVDKIKQCMTDTQCQYLQTGLIEQFVKEYNQTRNDYNNNNYNNNNNSNNYDVNGIPTPSVVDYNMESSYNPTLIPTFESYIPSSMPAISPMPPYPYSDDGIILESPIPQQYPSQVMTPQINQNIDPYISTISDYQPPVQPPSTAVTNVPLYNDNYNNNNNNNRMMPTLLNDEYEQQMQTMKEYYEQRIKHLMEDNIAWIQKYKALEAKCQTQQIQLNAMHTNNVKMSMDMTSDQNLLSSSFTSYAMPRSRKRGLDEFENGVNYYTNNNNNNNEHAKKRRRTYRNDGNCSQSPTVNSQNVFNHNMTANDSTDYSCD